MTQNYDVFDLNECRPTNPCQQNCKNTIGRFQCYCQDGFGIDPKDSTKCLDKKSIIMKSN